MHTFWTLHAFLFICGLLARLFMILICLLSKATPSLKYHLYSIIESPSHRTLCFPILSSLKDHPEFSLILAIFYFNTYLLWPQIETLRSSHWLSLVPWILFITITNDATFIISFILRNFGWPFLGSWNIFNQFLNWIYLINF